MAGTSFRLLCHLSSEGGHDFIDPTSVSQLRQAFFFNPCNSSYHDKKRKGMSSWPFRHFKQGRQSLSTQSRQELGVAISRHDTQNKTSFIAIGPGSRRK